MSPSEGVKSPRALFCAHQPIWKVKAMSNYDTIRDAIQDRTTSSAIQGHYATDPTGSQPRTFLAYVLGRSHDKGGGQHDCVLGYQYSGHNTASEDAKKWRCFKVDSFPPNSLVRVPFVPPSPTLSIPDPLTTEQLGFQKCVDHVESNRSVPYTPATTKRVSQSKSRTAKRKRTAATRRG